MVGFGAEQRIVFFFFLGGGDFIWSLCLESTWRSMVLICGMNDRRSFEDGAGLEHGLVSIFCDRGFVNRLRIDDTDDAKNGRGAPRLHFDSSPSFVEGIRMDSTGCEARDGRDDPNLRSDSDHSLAIRLGIEDTVGGAKEGPNPCRDSNGVSLGLGLSSEPETLENYDFSDVVLKYIGEILMEDDVQEKACMFQESTALHATEKSFYEVLGQSYQPLLSGEPEPLSCVSDNSSCEIKVVNLLDDHGCNSSASEGVDSGWKSEFGSGMFSAVDSQSTSFSSVISSSSSPSMDGFVDSPMSSLRLPEFFSDSMSALQFKKGVEEASRFLPDEIKLLVDLKCHSLQKTSLSTTNNVVPKLKANIDEGNCMGKRNPLSEIDVLDESRSHKQSAFCSETVVSPEMFDMVLLNDGKGETALREALQHVQQNEQLKGSTGGRGRRKRSGRRKDTVDLRTLLTLCAQAVAVNDRRTADDFLRQIRQHSSPAGDGMQRMAHYFANGLEARLAGSGTQIYTGLMSKPTSAADVLKAYHLYLAACPFKKISNFFSNKTIINVAQDAKKLHLIDFGILYGFQWPCLIQRLSSRAGGPPNLRITGIDFPQPGFRPADRVEETGRRLANYANTFGVPFKFKAIAQRWDTIRLTDLRIDPDEVLVINCMYRLRNLLDETVSNDSPRDVVLNLIRKANPDVFVLGIVNGTYSAPFFTSRFREALYHYSTIFDMLETNIPRDIPERLLLEREVFRWEAMNVIACEGSERIERPETYKQWLMRNTRAGFTQLPLNREIMDMAKKRVKTYYHKDFSVSEDGQWLLQGWKGRIVYGLSTWRPTAV